MHILIVGNNLNIILYECSIYFINKYNRTDRLSCSFAGRSYAELCPMAACVLVDNITRLQGLDLKIRSYHGMYSPLGYLSTDRKFVPTDCFFISGIRIFLNLCIQIIIMFQ